MQAATPCLLVGDEVGYHDEQDGLVPASLRRPYARRVLESGTGATSEPASNEALAASWATKFYHAPVSTAQEGGAQVQMEVQSAELEFQDLPVAHARCQVWLGSANCSLASSCLFSLLLLSLDIRGGMPASQGQARSSRSGRRAVWRRRVSRTRDTRSRVEGRETRDEGGGRRGLADGTEWQG